MAIAANVPVTNGAGRFFPPPRADRSMVRVLEHLDECLEPFDAVTARRALQDCVAPRLVLEPGGWCPPADAQRCRDWLGLLVLDGLLTRAVEIDGNRAQELLGPGDVLRPWDDDGVWATIPSVSSWRVIEPSSVALLDDGFAARAARWPSISVCLVRAAVRRSHAKSAILALTRARRADVRLMLLFWHLADRWGRMGADGVHVPLRLTHALLAELACLRRPTVSVALSELRARGELLRLADGTWRLAAGRGTDSIAGQGSTSPRRIA